MKKILWSLFGIVVLALVGGVVAYKAAPGMFSQGLSKWAERQGYDSAEHGELHILPFKGVISVNDLKLVRDGKTALNAASAEIRISPVALLQGRIQVDLIRLSGAWLQVQRDEGKAIVVGGLAMDDVNTGESKRAKDANFSINMIHVLDSEVYLKLPRLESTIKVDDLRIADSKDITVGKIQLDNLQVKISRDKSGNWQFKSAGDSLEGAFEMGAGENSDVKFAPALAGLSLKIDTIEVTGNSSIQYRDTILDVAVEQQMIIDAVRLTGLDTSRPEQAMQFVIRKHNPQGVSSSWEGEAYLFKQQPEISVRGRIESTKESLISRIATKSLGLEMSRGMAVIKLQVEVAGREVSGYLSIQTSDLRLSAEGKEVLGMREGVIRVSLAELLRGELKIESANLDGARLTVERLKDSSIKIAGITLAEEDGGGSQPDRPAYPIESLNITNGQVEILAPGLQLTLHVNKLQASEGRRIVADVVSFPDLNIGIVHAGVDDWRLTGEHEGTRFEYGFGAKGHDKNKSQSLFKGLALKVNQIKLAGDSRLQYKDTSSGVPINWALSFDQAWIKNIDSEKPDSLNPIVLSMNSDHYERFDLEGSIKLFAPTPELTINGRAEAIRLTPLSPLTDAGFGFAIDTGQADADIKLKVADNKIDGRIDLKINLLSVSTTDRAKLTPFEASLYEGLKLRQMVRLLTDKRGVMPIGLPLSGDPRAPSFELEIDMDAAFKKAVTGVVGLVIAPGLTSMIREVRTLRKRLAALYFASGSYNLSEKAESKLAKAAKKLIEDPQRLVTVCGTAGDHEFASAIAADGKNRALASLAIAARRAALARKRLIDDYGIEAKRLIACRPALKDYQPEHNPDDLVLRRRPANDVYVEIR